MATFQGDYIDGAQELYLWAINTGEYYENHKFLALCGNAIDWRNLVDSHASDYMRQFKGIKFDNAELDAAARSLQKYYVDHVAEINDFLTAESDNDPVDLLELTRNFLGR